MKERKEKNVSYLSEEVSTPAAPLGVSTLRHPPTPSNYHPLTDRFKVNFDKQIRASLRVITDPRDSDSF